MSKKKELPEIIKMQEVDSLKLQLLMQKVLNLKLQFNKDLSQLEDGVVVLKGKIAEENGVETLEELSCYRFNSETNELTLSKEMLEQLAKSKK